MFIKIIVSIAAIASATNIHWLHFARRSSSVVGRIIRRSKVKRESRRDAIAQNPNRLPDDTTLNLLMGWKPDSLQINIYMQTRV